MSNIKKILYQTDLAKIFGITVKTFRKNRDIIIYLRTKDAFSILK